MPWLALAIGVLAAWGMHRLFFHNTETNSQKRSKWLWNGGLLITLLLAWRVGLLRNGAYLLWPLLKRWANSESQHQAQASASSSMERKEAAKILGVAENAEPQAINAAYKQLMTKLHPDAGGNSYLAQKLNEARDCLLG